MFQYIISYKNRNKILLPDDRENVKLTVAINNLFFLKSVIYILLCFFTSSCRKTIYVYIYVKQKKEVKSNDPVF